MKIGILTQPLHNNYGGLLQAFALQKVLNDMGHEVITVNFANKHIAWYIKALSVCKRLLLYIVKGGKGVIRIWPTKGESMYISKHTTEFVKQHIKVTEKITGDNASLYLKHLNVDAFIVGSDQVWRPKYSPHLPSFFLDFLPAISPVRCIAYAASFGVDNWEFNDQQTAMAKTEIRKFQAVSVREDSAVELCDKYLDCTATQVLDPTLLLSKEDYINIFQLEQQPKSEGKLFTYILDETHEKKDIINDVSQKLGIAPFKVLPNKKFSQVGVAGINETLYPPVEKWLRAFMDADFVITDSFHGTVFAIIFNKPFISVGNTDRGLSRFQSLLKQLGLEHRLFVGESNLISQSIQDSVDWQDVDSQLITRRYASMRYLSDALTSK